MLNALAWSQWRWSRTTIGLSALVTTALPLIVLRAPAIAGGSAYGVQELLLRSKDFSAVFQFSAAATGVGLALAVWIPDARIRNVYPAILPISRQRYALVRFALGFAFLAIPAAALLLSAKVGGARAPVPEVLRVYAGGISARWFLGAASAYSLVLGVLSISPKAIRRLAMIVAGVLLLDAAYAFAVDRTHPLLVVQIANGIFSEMGPYAPFLDEWMLIDV